jgi:N,N'-diacetyllegionaminate synthase
MKNKIFKKNQCFIIAEIALSHEGSLGIALSMIDKAATCGVDAVKFQAHFPEHESSVWETFRTNGNLQDKTRFEYWKRTSFNEEEWLIIKNHCDRKNVLFLCTPFSIHAAMLLQKMEILAWKISSGDITNYPLLDFISSTNKPILISTGMSDYSEIASTVEYLNSSINNLCILQCTNSYPCPPEEIGLLEIPKLKELFGVDIGFSDHSGKIGSCIAAFTLGASVLEVHVTWDKEFYGPDVTSSLTFDELRTLTDSIRYLEKSFSSRNSKNDLKISHEHIRKLFMKGIYVNRNKNKGEIIGIDDLSFKKPVKGIPASDYISILGEVLKNDVFKDEPLMLSDFHDK